MSSGLLSAVDRLEAALSTADPVAELRTLGDPSRLHLLFQAQLCRLIRGGPAAESDGGLRHLLSVAQEASERGMVPLMTSTALRAALERLEAGLRDAGAWDSARPLWWAPLPAAIRIEKLWEALGHGDGPLLTFPAGEGTAAAFSGPDPRRWLILSRLVAGDLLQPLHRELETAGDGDGLGLERAGVGAGDRLSSRRWDAVRYLTGREPELLRAVPRLATLVQWGLAHLAERLAAVTGAQVFPPQNAMLARYPAPSGGFAPHLDNPGGERDNGRTLTLVIYLNHPGAECAGGELALWSPGAATTDSPAAVVPAADGSAVLFDSRAVAHQVRPLAAGPARWALTFWLNDTAREPAPQALTPRLTVTDALLAIPEPPLPPGSVLFHQLDDHQPEGEITVHRPGPATSRIGLVSTVYRGGADLDAWCAHHFACGADHVVLVFDHPEEPAEAADAARLRGRHSAERLTIWPADEAAERWRSLSDRDLGELLRLARCGASSHAVAARQTLNASAVLAAARGEELGGAPLDWLIHLDADELLYLEGSGRGGATLRQHFAAAEAAGLERVRYLNHELLAGPPGDRHPEGRSPLFKLNPRLAAARLGGVGWSKLAAHLGLDQDAPGGRLYFHGYLNGKSAVAVRAAAAAAGVHGWYLEDPAPPAASLLVAGPSVLHFHFSSPAAFRRKYLAIAASPAVAAKRPFAPCPAEVAAVDLLRSLRREGAGEATVHRRLDELHRRLTSFHQAEIEILESAGLILRPRLEHRLTGPAAGAGPTA